MPVMSAIKLSLFGSEVLLFITSELFTIPQSQGSFWITSIHYRSTY